MKTTQGGLNPEPEGKWHRCQGSGGWLLIGQKFGEDVELYLSERVLSWSWAAPGLLMEVEYSSGLAGSPSDKVDSTKQV